MMNKIRSGKSLLLLPMTLVTLFGCSDRTAPEIVQPPEPVESIAPQLDTTRTTIELIGPEGGSVVMEDANGLLYTLDIAPGILPVDVEISMTPVVDIPDLNFAEEFLVGVQFGPEGLYMVEPAILTVELPADTDLSNLTAFGWRGAGDSIYLEPIKRPAPSLVLPIAHFSGEAVVVGDPDDALDLIVADESIEAVYKAELARVADEVAFGICGLDQQCYVSDEYGQQFRNRFPPKALGVFGEWLDEISRQVDDPDALKDPLVMMREYFSWTATAGLLLCDGGNSCATIRDNYGISIDSVRDKATQQVMKLFEEHGKNCDDFAVYQLLYNNIIFSMGDSQSGFEGYLAQSVNVEEQVGAIADEIKRLFRCNLEIVVSGFPGAFSIDSPDEDISVQLNNNSDVLELALENISVSLSNKGDGCSELNGATNTVAVHPTDATGRVVGLKMNANACEAGSKVILDVEVADNLLVDEPEKFFFGHSVHLEADVVDPCAPAPQGSAKLAREASKKTAPDSTCDEANRIAYVTLASAAVGNEIVTINPDGSDKRVLPLSGLYFNTPSWSPDRTRLAFAGQGLNGSPIVNIYIADADGSNLEQLTTSNDSLKPSFSPDGQKLVFARYVEYQLHLYTINVDGTGETRLTYDDADHYDPAWSPDGSKIAYSCNGDICVINADGTGSVALTNNLEADYFPSWSPDSSQIAFTIYEGGSQLTLYIMNADGTNLRRIATGPFVTVSTVSWSPDGNQLVFSGIRSDSNPYQYELVLIDRDGTNMILIPNSESAHHPAWAE